MVSTKKQTKEYHPTYLTEQIIHLSVMAFLYIVFLQIQLMYFADIVKFEEWMMIIITVLFVLISIKFTKIYWALVHHRKQNNS